MGICVQSGHPVGKVFLWAALAIPYACAQNVEIPAVNTELLKQAYVKAASLLPDAYPVAVEARSNVDYRDRNAFKLVFWFYSPSKKKGAIASVSKFDPLHAQLNTTTNWTFVDPIPSFPIDLPEAVNRARQNGLEGGVARAFLMIWKPRGKPPVLAWQITPARRDQRVFNIDAISGTLLTRGDISDPPPGSDAELAAAWNRLLGAFRQGTVAGGKPLSDAGKRQVSVWCMDPKNRGYGSGCFDSGLSLR